MKLALFRRTAKGNSQTALTLISARPTRASCAFTRVDLVTALAAVALLSAAILPGWANLRTRSDRVVCLNNLQLIGQAFHVWGADHNDYRPFRTLESQGGTMPDSGIKVGNVWYEMAWISNELATPKILVCPSDTETSRIAIDFSNNPDGGFVHSGYRNNAVSYILGVDSLPELPMSVLSGDRNLRVDAVNSGCSSRINNVATIYPGGQSSPTRWSDTIHRRTGNVLFNDGRVQTITGAEVPSVIGGSDDNGSTHLLMPK